MQYTLKQDNQVRAVIDGEFVRIIKTSERHVSTKYNGFGVSPSTLDEGEKRGASTVEIIAAFSGERYLVPIQSYRLAGIPDNLGMGTQLFISRKNLKFYTKQYQESKKPKQMSLFG